MSNPRTRRLRKLRRKHHAKKPFTLPRAKREGLDRLALHLNLVRRESAIPHRRGRIERDEEFRARVHHFMTSIGR